MNPAEIELMASVEGVHWWYRGLRDVIRRTLHTPRFRLPPHASILDAGCGTGENLLFVQRLVQPAYLGGFDRSFRAVSLCRAKVCEADVYVGDLRDPEVHVDHLDLVLSCDALSIAGIADSQAGLARLVERLRRGGLLILNLPAFQWLYSGHDVAIRTRERVTAGQVRRLLLELGLSVELLTYRLFFLFPAIVLARLPSMLRLNSRSRAARSDLKRSPPWINTVLRAILSAENAALIRGVRFPCGSSVYAVGRRI